MFTSTSAGPVLFIFSITATVISSLSTFRPFFHGSVRKDPSSLRSVHENIAPISMQQRASTVVRTGKFKNSIVAIPLPSGPRRMEIMLSNDDIVAKSVKESTDSIAIYVYYIENRTVPKTSMIEYVSTIYSRAWDEMVQAKKLSLECFVAAEAKSAICEGMSNIQEEAMSLSVDALYLHTVEPLDNNALSTPNCILKTVNDFRNKVSVENKDSNMTVVNSRVPPTDPAIVCYFDEPCLGTIDAPDIPTYKSVALGGSFDHLHNGHRKLLYLASLTCTDMLTIGITGDAMLSAKTHADLIIPYHTRQQAVKQYMARICPSLKLNIVELKDPFGPTVTDPDIEAIVVSSETLPGAKKINQIRLTSQTEMKPLDILVTRRSDGAVLSSTFIRNQQARSSH